MTLRQAHGRRQCAAVRQDRPDQHRATTDESRTLKYWHDYGIRLFTGMVDVKEVGVNDCFVEAGAELQRTQVAPEGDAFAFATIASHAGVTPVETDLSRRQSSQYLDFPKRRGY